MKLYSYFFLLLFSAIFLFASASIAQECTNPTGYAGTLIFNSDHDIFQGCTRGGGWVALHGETGYSPSPGVPTNCPNIGDTCDDGSIYAGLSPDGNVPVYTTPADAGRFSWNDGSTNFVDIPSFTNCTGAEATCYTGEANTALLAALGTGPSPAPYVAARHCHNLIAHGHSDWYLPAKDELNVLYINHTAIGGFNTNGFFTNPTGVYYSSSEVSMNESWNQYFGNDFPGVQSGGRKDTNMFVRCVRR